MIKIALADDHTVVREGFRMVLETQSDFQVIGEARDGLEAIRVVEQLKPDVLVVDLMMPLNWGVKPQALYLIKPQKPNLSEQDQQFLSSFASLTELVLGNTQLLAEVKSSQASLQELSHRLVRVHEEERRNLARELHDEIGQYLTGLKLRFNRVEVNGEGDKGDISDAQELLNELIRKVRKLSLDLRPSVLDDLGLLPALEWYFTRYTQQTGIEVDFDPQLPERQRFSNEIEISIYRIVQESLTNVARHAGGEVGVSGVEVNCRAGGIDD